MNLPLAVLVPFLSAALVAAASRLGRRHAAWVAGAVTLSSITLLAPIASHPFAGEVVLWRGVWLPSAGLDFAFRLDGLGLLLSVLIVVGAAFTFVGSLALVRLRDFYTRLHGPTKATTLGVGSLLVASSIYFGVTGDGVSAREALITLFLFITAPVSAHLLAKAALHHRLSSLAPLPAEETDRDDTQSPRSKR